MRGKSTEKNNIFRERDPPNKVDQIEQLFWRIAKN